VKLKLLLICAFVGCLALTSRVALADGVSVQNASFESFFSNNPLNSPCLGSGCGFNGGSMPGWTVSGSGGQFQPSSSYFNLPLPDGNIVAYSNGGSISQTLGVSLLPDSIYTLSVFVGDRLDNRFANYSINLMAGSTSLCTFSGSNASITPGMFADETCTYQSGSSLPAGNLSILLTSAGTQTDFDNVSLNVNSVSVPEPSSLALVCAGFLCVGVLFIFLKRRQNLLQMNAS
jgi:PEP-CTERM motif